MGKIYVVDCPSCSGSTRVLESRRADGGEVVRRRRECPGCGRRFTTFERREPDRVWVLKRSGARQRFDRHKLAGGLARAAHKRPVAPEDIMRLVVAIEEEGANSAGELRAERIGELSMEGLRSLDRVAYLQFAAVYKGFSDPRQFTDELRSMGVEPARTLGDSGRSVPSAPGATVDGPLKEAF
ncbi:MAG: transcriptional regulator NrdR [Actinomycetota bacterium]|nr:transcriptional regulator NrdR [Actinomycetota bacterium]